MGTARVPFDEVTELSYQGNLEAFWETRFGKSTVLRFTAANLLDAEKVEDVTVFNPDLQGRQRKAKLKRNEAGVSF